MSVFSVTHVASVATSDTMGHYCNCLIATTSTLPSDVTVTLLTVCVDSRVAVVPFHTFVPATRPEAICCGVGRPSVRAYVHPSHS